MLTIVNDPLVGSEAVELLVSLCTPNDITTKSYEDLTAMLTRHYGCGENEVISSYQFDTRDQAETETISEFRYGSKLIHAQSSVNAVKQHKSQQQRRFGKPKSASHVDFDQKCYRCHGKHTANACRFKNAKCFNCNKIGHISKACRN